MRRRVAIVLGISMFCLGSIAQTFNPIYLPVNATNAVSGLRHPGVLQSAEMVNALADDLVSGNANRLTRWDQLMNDSRGKITKPTDWNPPSNFDNYAFLGAIKQTSIGLQRYVLDYVMTQNTQSETNAITMLNAWGNVNWNLGSMTNTTLYGGIYMGYLAHWADMLISAGSSWDVAEQNVFKNKCSNLFLPFFTLHKNNDFNGNWDLGATWSALAMAVLLDDRALYDQYIDYIRYGETNGRLEYYLLPNGQNQESGRDQDHAQMGLFFATRVCQVAWNQGIDLFDPDSLRSLGRCFEHYAAYNLKTPMVPQSDLVPFQRYVNGISGENNDKMKMSTAGRGQFEPGYELIYHHYKTYRNTDLPYCGMVLSNETRPETGGGNDYFYNTLCFEGLVPTDRATRMQPAVDVSIDFTVPIKTAYYGLNLGGENYTEASGFIYCHDTDPSGVHYHVTNRVSIAQTQEDGLYQTATIGDNFTYTMKLLAGSYLMRLHFSELEGVAPSERIFDVYATTNTSSSTPVLIMQNVDVCSAGGGQPNSASWIDIPVTVVGATTGDVRLRLQGVKGLASISGVRFLNTANVTGSTPAKPSGVQVISVEDKKITLSWNAVSGADYYIVKRSLNSTGPFLPLAGGITAPSYSDHAVENGLPYYYVVSAVSSTGKIGPHSAAVLGQGPGTLPSPWQSTRIGSTLPDGQARYDFDTYSLHSSGTRISYTGSDNCVFMHQTHSGDVTVTAHITFQDDPLGVDASAARAGVMIRESTSANAMMACMSVSPRNGSKWIRRYVTGNNSSESYQKNKKAPYWLRVVRSGDFFSGYGSDNGITWYQLEKSYEIPMSSSNYLIGLGGCSGSASVMARSSFDYISVVSGTITYSLSYSSPSNGVIQGSALQVVGPNGSGTSVTAVPATGYAFDRWSDGVSTATRMDQQVSGNLAVTASFIPVNTSPGQTWKEGWFNAGQLANPQISGWNADPDGDELSNLIEYALGGNPNSVDAALLAPRIEVIMGGASCDFIYRRRVDAATRQLTYQVEQRSALDSGGWGSGPAEHSTTGLNAEFEEVRHRASTSSDPHLFMRLKVEISE